MAPDRVALPAVILVGHGSFDHRDSLGFQTGSQIPPYIEKSVIISTGAVENSIDFPFGLVDGADQIMDVQMARIPARTSDLVDEHVARVIAHDALEQTLYEATRTGVIVLDNDSEFQGDASTWVDLWEQTGRTALFYSLVSTNASTIQSNIRTAFADPTTGGSAFALYIGHGNSNTWAGESIVTNSAITTFTTENQWPLVSTYTCLNHFYAFPDPTNPAIAPVCLGETWLFQPGDGAIASIAPTSLDFYFSQRLFAMEAMELLALPEGQRPRTIGELFAMTQINFGVAYPGLGITNREYLLFGDPQSSLALTDTVPVELSAFSLE
jgi:hypothetical protein